MHRSDANLGIACAQFRPNGTARLNLRQFFRFDLSYLDPAAYKDRIAVPAKAERQASA